MLVLLLQTQVKLFVDLAENSVFKKILESTSSRLKDHILTAYYSESVTT